jgi:glycosyltransferase involved in cell wall biosynthesis
VRILAVGNMYPPHHFGGYELVWQSAMGAARARGHEVRILTSDYRLPGPSRPEHEDVHRALRWHWDWERREWVRLGALARLRLERHNRAELARHLREFSPQVISWWSMGGMSLSLIERARRQGPRSVLVVHDDWLVYGPREDAWMRIWHRKQRPLGSAVERATGVPTRFQIADWGRFLFNSEYTREQARRQGIDPPDAAVVTPGVAEHFLDAAPEREWRGRLLYVGRVGPEKGVDTAVAALAELPSASLRIVGDGHRDYVAELRAAAEGIGAGGRLRIDGAVSAERLADVYGEADAVLFPVRWKEPWGLVPLEAMGRGRPVIATLGGGTREYLRDGENALVVPADDPGAVARAAAWLEADPGLRQRLREGGLRTARSHRAVDFDRTIVNELERAAGNRG